MRSISIGAPKILTGWSASIATNSVKSMNPSLSCRGQPQAAELGLLGSTITQPDPGREEGRALSPSCITLVRISSNCVWFLPLSPNEGFTASHEQADGSWS